MRLIGNVLLTTGFVMSVLLSSTAMGCGDAADMVHVGRVAAIDQSANTFTINDMETGQTITFQADKKLLLHVAASTRAVTVSYAKDGETLVAQSIQ